MTQNFLTDAIDALRANNATETCQLFKNGTWLLTATMLPTLNAEARRGALELLPVATLADRVHHVAFTNASIGGTQTDAVSWLDTAVDTAQAISAPPRLVLYPYVQKPGQTVTWGEPVDMGAESAIFGEVTDAFSAAAPALASVTPVQLDALRVRAIDHLTQIEVAVQMSEEFSAELHALLERVG